MTHQPAEHVLSYQTLFFVLFALLVLTGITVGVSRIDLGALNIWIALLIASVKASLVLMFFMHLRYETALMRTGFFVTVFTLAIFIGLMFFDLAFR